jgi:hypothetical protein
MPHTPSADTTSPALGFALFAGLAAFALAAFAPALMNDGDTYWHIRAGQWMIAHRAILRADVFSYTMVGAAWHTQEWLAEIAMALSWRAGWAGLHLLFGACAAVMAGTVGYFVRRRVDFLPALLTVLLGLSCVASSLLARPHLLALPLLALWTTGLVQAREKDSSPSWWLILLMPLWANLHASFAFGLALAVGFGAEAVIEGQNRKRSAFGWGFFILAATAFSLLTPFGIEGLLFPFRLSGLASLRHIGEWQPSDFTSLSPFAIALLAGIGALAMGRIRLTPVRTILLLGLVWLALSHGRHQMLLGVTAPILLAPALKKAWPAGTKSANPLFAGLAALGFALLIGLRLLLPVVRSDDPVSPMTALEHVPRFVRESPVLNDYSFGGYLIWSGVRPFIDSRADLYGELFLENYASITEPDEDALAAALAYYHVRWTIFSRQAPVVKLLDATPGWHRFYSDKLAVVHVHD